MKTINLTDTSSLEDVLKQAHEEETVVLRNGHAVALVVPFDDEDMAWYARERDPAFIDSIAKARAQAAAGKTVGHAELKRQLGLGG